MNSIMLTDGIRPCKAKRYRYKHSDMANLEEVLQESKAAKAFRLQQTVSSMDGDIAKLAEICALAGEV